MKDLPTLTDQFLFFLLQLIAMASLAPFTRIAQMGSFTPTLPKLIYWPLRLYPAPGFEPIRHPFCIRIFIQIR